MRILNASKATWEDAWCGWCAESAGQRELVGEERWELSQAPEFRVAEL